MAHLTKGQKLSILVLNILTNKPLTIVQKAVLADATGGSYEPLDLKKSHKEIMALSKANNITELIRLYKQLPRPPSTDGIYYILDGVRMESAKEAFEKINSDWDGTIEVNGVSTTSNAIWENLKAGKGTSSINEVFKGSSKTKAREIL